MMRILQIPKDEKILRLKSKPVDPRDIKSNKIQTFIKELYDTMIHSDKEVGESAVGISAIQVGNPIQMFFAQNIQTGKIVLYINPKITVLDPTLVIMEEGCLSVPNRVGKVARVKKISVSYLDRNGNPQKKVLSGFNARVVLHEYDHLQGILFIDKLV